MSSATVGSHHHSGAGPLSLMSCVRESSPPQDCDSDNEKNVTTKRRFWNPRKWFKRKNKVSDDVVVVDVSETNKEALRSRSTSELSVTDEGRRRSSSSMHPALSVSHDSVFHSPNSGSDIELDTAQSSSSLSICQPHVDTRLLQTELNERLRVRRGRGDVSEDDEGFPHSSCNSPTTSDGILLDKTASKDLPTKSHSTCSDGSLLSMGSYEMDEDFSESQSRHSSKLSLQDKKPGPDSNLELGPCSVVAPLNHSAAHHRVSVKPKRTHGIPRRKRGQQLTALPVTPEVNEESSTRSISPEYVKKESLTELYSINTARILTESQIKCASLPPGLTPPGVDTSKLNRSKSNAGTDSSQDPFATVPENAEKEDRPSLLERIFPRKSSRKKKLIEERELTNEVTRQEVTVNASAATKTHLETTTSKPIPAPRSGPASRQRIQPINIPPSPDETRKDDILPDKELTGTSPIHTELENRLDHKQIFMSTSPPAPIPRQFATPPLSPRAHKPPHSPLLPTVISSKLEYSSHYTKSSSNVAKVRSEDFRSKMKLPGLSSLQQRVLTLNDDTDDGFKSLMEFTPEYPKSLKPLTKSQSFKSRDPIKTIATEYCGKEQKEQNRISFTKAASLDSVKNLDEKKTHLSEMTFELARSKQEETEMFGDVVTISGPSHTAIVNVSTKNVEDFGSKTHTVESAVVDGSHNISIKEHQVSVTKIQLKQEQTQSTITVASDFWNKQLNKVDSRPASNIVFSMKSPKIVDEKTRPNTFFNFDTTTKPPAPRKFSKENLEIIEKDKDEESMSPPPLVVSLTQSARYKKNDSKTSSRKSSVISITPESPAKDKTFKSRSSSLDSLKSDSDKSSSQDSLDKVDNPKDKNVVGESVVLRRKSAVKKNEDESELMKVFARRSLKIKDIDAQSIQENLDDNKMPDNNKENQLDTQSEECKKLANEILESETFTKSPVLLRRTVNNNIFVGQRSLSVNPSRSKVSESLVKKQSSFLERRKTDQWMTSIKYEEPELKEKIMQDEIISNISPKSDFINEPKNFNQRKAEWEKRAQLAQKKNTP